MTTPKPIFLAALTALLPALAACTFLVKFNDKEDDEDDAGAPEDASVDARREDVVVPPPDAPPTGCAGRAQNGYVNPTDKTRACCDGVEVDLTASPNCGGCGIACSPGHTCTLEPNGHYYCVGCGTGGGRASCWSNCCSNRYGGICAPNDCDNGNCVDSNCTSRGMVCVPGGPTSGSYCEFP
ncbi:MAG: hypothetical protein U0235_23070 [Polyangiaceae bacterium]